MNVGENVQKALTRIAQIIANFISPSLWFFFRGN